MMEIKRSFILIEDYEGNIYRVASKQDEQFQALNLLSHFQKDGKLPVIKDCNLEIEEVDETQIKKISE